MTEDTKVRPALTPEEWEEGTSGREPYNAYLDTYLYRGLLGRTPPVFETDSCSDDGWPPVQNEIRRPHATAALCLHGQPFGFTWEDVDALRGEFSFHYMRQSHSVADRLAALLPPREETQ